MSTSNWQDEPGASQNDQVTPDHQAAASFDDPWADPGKQAPHDLGPDAGDAPAFRHDDGGEYQDNDNLHDDIVDAEPVARKKGRPVALLAVGGLVLVTIVGVIGTRAVKALSSARSEPQVAQQVVDIPAAPAGVLQSDQPLAAVDPGVFGSDPSALVVDQPTFAAPVAADEQPLGAQPLPKGDSSQGDPAQVAVQAPAATVAATANAEVTELGQRVDQVESTVKSIEAKVDAIGTKLNSTKAAKPGAKAPKRTTEKQARSAPAKKPVAKARAEKKEAVALAGLSLRAVYPTAGPDMQAWVAQGEEVRVVVKGSYIDGATVLEVKPDVVLTDRGPIR